MGKPKKNPKEHMNVMTTRSGKQVKTSDEKSKEVWESVLTPPEKEVVREEDKEESYVDPPPYKL